MHVVSSRSFDSVLVVAAWLEADMSCVQQYTFCEEFMAHFTVC